MRRNFLPATGMVMMSLSATLASADTGSLESITTESELSYQFQPAEAEPSPLRLVMSAEVDDVQLPELTERSDMRAMFGDKGTSRLDVHIGYGFEVQETSNSLILAGVGYSYFMRDDFAIVVELNGLYIDQRGPNAVGINLNLLLRYHFISEATWSIYLDGGAGIVFFDEEVPAGASEFNFTPQLGLGFTYDIGSDNRLMAGVRWYHISNANTDPFNPGRDHAYFYAGVSLPF